MLNIIPPKVILHSIMILLYFLTVFIPFMAISQFVADYIGIPSDIILYGVVLIILTIMYIFIISIRNLT